MVVLSNAPVELFVAQQGGMWQPIITWMQIIVGAAATLTIIAGAALIASMPYDEELRATGWEMIIGASMGLIIALLAVPAYNLFEEWIPGEPERPGDQGSAIAPIHPEHLAASPSFEPAVIAKEPFPDMPPATSYEPLDTHTIPEVF